MTYSDCIESVHQARLQEKLHPEQTHFYPLKILLCWCNYIGDVFLGYVCILNRYINKHNDYIS